MSRPVGTSRASLPRIAGLVVLVATAVTASEKDVDVALREAVLARDQQLVAELLDRGAEPAFGLGAAARTGNLDLLDVLVEAGADLGGIRAAEALAIAYMTEQTEVSRELENLGVDLDARDEAGRTALIWAAGRSRLGPLLDAAIRYGADVDAASRTGETALMTAARHGRLGAARLLVAAGADLELTDRDGWTALMFAVRSSQSKMVALLLSAGAETSVESVLGWTPLMVGARAGDLRSVHRLLRRGADPAYRTWAQPQPLVHAIRSGSLPVVRRLLEAGAEPGTGVEGDALWWARYLGDRRAVKILSRRSGTSE